MYGIVLYLGVSLPSEQDTGMMHNQIHNWYNKYHKDAKCFEAPGVRCEEWRNSVHGGNISLAFVIGETLCWDSKVWRGAINELILWKACSQGQHESKYINGLKNPQNPIGRLNAHGWNAVLYTCPVGYQPLPTATPSEDLT